jgi:hypothetical protein
MLGLSNQIRTDLNCNENVNCHLEQSKAVILIDPEEDDSFIVGYFWHAMAHGTYVFFYSPLDLGELAPMNVFHRMDGIYYSDTMEKVINLLNISNHHSKLFEWKQTNNTNIEKLLKFSQMNFPCNLCMYVKLTKR